MLEQPQTKLQNNFLGAFTQDNAQQVKTILSTASKEQLLNEIGELRLANGNTVLHTVIINNNDVMLDSLLNGLGGSKFHHLQLKNFASKSALSLLTNLKFKEVFGIVGDYDDHVLSAVKSHLDFFGMEQAWYTTLYEGFFQVGAIAATIYYNSEQEFMPQFKFTEALEEARATVGSQRS